MQGKNSGFTNMTMRISFFKFLASCFAGLFLLSACLGDTTTSSPTPTREILAKPPFRSASIGPGGATRNVPTLEDLFGRFQEEEVRIAILLPLTGPGASAGSAFLDAASMALFESYDPRLQLFPLDTHGTPEGARAAALEAVNREADIVLGPLFSSSIETVRPVLRSAGIKIIGFSNNPDVAGNGVYLFSFLPEQEAQRVVTFAASQDYLSFAALIPDTPYGEAVLEGFAEGVFNSGRAISGLEIYQRSTQTVFEPVKRLANYEERRADYVDEERFLESLDPDDFADEILKKLEAFETIGELPFDAVLVPEGGQFLRSMVPLLPFYEVDPNEIKFLGTGLWHDPSLIGEPSLEGAWFAGADPVAVEDFMTRFQGFYGYRPPRIATLAYDAVGLIASLSRIEVRRNRFSDETLMNANGFRGVDGLFRFLPNGTTERGLAVLEITGEGFVVVSPAPESFSRQ